MRTIFDITIDFERSHGSYLVDKKSGHEYLDFFNMYSSLPLGYNHDIFDASFDKTVSRVAKMRVANNVLQTDELGSFLKAFRKYVPSDFIHLTCTGALAVESALKCALEYRKAPDAMVLGVRNSFHGVNSWGFLTDRVFPSAERMKYYPKNSWQNLSIAEITQYIAGHDPKTIAAVLIEPVQCTIGDIYLKTAELLALQEVCRKNDICVIVDEIQTGFGTTGAMWYSDKIGLTPDILVFGKKSQVCGLVASPKYSECMTSPYQKLEVTFDGELIDAIRSEYILRAYERDGLIERANSNSTRFREILAHRTVNYRSAGHLIAFDLENRAARDSFIAKCRENRFLCNSAGESTVRMRPNLAVSADEIAHFQQIMERVL